MLKSLANFTDNPWGDNNSGNGSSGGKSTKGSASNNVLEIEKLLNKYKKNFSGGKGGQTPNSPKSIFSIILIVIALYFSTGFFTIQPEEEGVVLLFGKFSRVTAPGLHYHLPTPFEKLIKVKVTQINSIEIGYRNLGGDRISSRNEESIMLTGDENIVDAPFSVMWKINDPARYQFNLRDRELTVKSIAESAMREVVAKTDVQSVMTNNKNGIELEVMQITQDLLNRYEAGIQITQVKMEDVRPPAEISDAFNDVQKAEADRDKTISLAKLEQNRIVPDARGQAARMLQEAEGYKQKVIAEAEGEASRFEAILGEYTKAKDVTRRRLYLDTMQQVLTGTDKVMIDSQGAGVVPYLPLPELNKRNNQ
ncbi:MAG: FtsH protease activity modulator HflK [Kordiimonadaceae bacterium]|nr:FtsH protease activity modulator HflK [Kordiimonadaceae bacterium]